MFDKVIQKEKVKDFLKEIFNNPKYYDKKIEEVIKNDYVLHQAALLLFYDALYKYQILVNEEENLEDFIDSLDTLFKRLDNIDDIKYGISKLLGKLVAKKLDLDEEKNEEEILRYIYEKYVKNGYYILGLSSIDYYDITSNGKKEVEIPKEVEELNEILKKYNFNILEDENYTFNTDITKACIRSINAPNFLYKLVLNNEYVKNNLEAYYLKDKELCKDNLNKVLNKLEVNDTDKKEIINLFNIIWDRYNNSDNNIYLVFFERKNVEKEYKISDDFSYDESLYNIFTTNDDVLTKDKIDQEVVYYVELPNHFEYVKNIEDKKNSDKKIEIVDDDFKFNNKYGKVSIFILFGTLLILLGVVVTIIVNL